MLTRGYKNVFDTIFLYTPSFYHDPLWRHVDIPPNNVRDEIEEEDLKHKYDLIEKTNRKNKVLFIFDDMSGNSALKSISSSSTFEKLVCNARWMNCSIIHCSQKITHISTGMRECAEGMFVVTLPSKREMKLIDDSISIWKLYDFITLVAKCTQNPYEFIYFRRNPSLSVFHNTKQIWPTSTNK